jgi:hypothetical protein
VNPPPNIHTLCRDGTTIAVGTIVLVLATTRHPADADGTSLTGPNPASNSVLKQASPAPLIALILL